MRNRRCTFVLALIFAAWCVTPGIAAESTVDGSFQRTLSVNGPVDLDVSTGAGRIDVKAGGTTTVEIHAVIRVSLRGRTRSEAESIVRMLESKPPVDQTGNTIRIGKVEDRDARRNVSISYEITTPATTRLHASTGAGSQAVTGIAGPVDATTGSGSIDILDIRDEVRAQTGSGSIRLNNIKGSVSTTTGSGGIDAMNVGGAFKGSTGSGSVHMSQSAPGSVDVSTGSGGIEVSSVRGSLRAHTGSGSIKADGEPTGPWDIETSSGSVVVRVPQQAAFDLNARTSSGGITVDHPLTTKGTFKRNEVTGSVRGGGIVLNVRTASGNIRIQ